MSTKDRLIRCETKRTSKTTRHGPTARKRETMVEREGLRKTWVGGPDDSEAASLAGSRDELEIRLYFCKLRHVGFRRVEDERALILSCPSVFSLPASGQATPRPSRKVKASVIHNHDRFASECHLTGDPFLLCSRERDPEVRMPFSNDVRYGWWNG